MSYWRCAHHAPQKDSRNTRILEDRVAAKTQLFVQVHNIYIYMGSVYIYIHNNSNNNNVLYNTVCLYPLVRLLSLQNKLSLSEPTTVYMRCPQTRPPRRETPNKAQKQSTVKTVEKITSRSNLARPLPLLKISHQSSLPNPSKSTFSARLLVFHTNGTPGDRSSIAPPPSGRSFPNSAGWAAQLVEEQVRRWEVQGLML